MSEIQSLGNIAQSAVGKTVDARPQPPTREEAASNHVGREMEGMFLAMMLKQLRSTEQGEGLFAGDKSDTLGSMFDQFLGDHLAENGGIGIADLMRQSQLIDASGFGGSAHRNAAAMEAYHHAVRTN